MQQLLKFLRFSAGDRRLVTVAFLVLGTIRLGLWLLPFRTLHALLRKIAPMSPDLPEASSAAVERGVWAVGYASRRMSKKPKCLARALTTQVLLRWQGYRTHLRIGVAKDLQGRLAAHAWVESRGEIIIGNLSTLSEFTTLPSLEREAA